MKRFLILFLLFFYSSAYATPISQLTEEATSLAVNDLLVISYYTPAAYVSKKITVNNFFSGGGTLTNGDIFHWNGSKLTNATPTTAGQILRFGTTTGWTTSTFADSYPKGSFLYNATANTVDALAHPGTSNYLLSTNSADTVGWFASSSDIITFLGSADAATARTNLGAQTLNANLTAIAGITPTANCVYAHDGSVVLGCFETHTHDNSAAQFIDATVITKKVKIDPAGITATKTATHAYRNTDDASFTAPVQAGYFLATVADGATTEVLVGGGASTLPVWTTATGTGAPVRAGTPTLITPVIGAATGTSLTLTGVIDALVTTTVGSGAISVTAKNAYVICTAACQVTLPVAAAGNQYCVRNAPGSATIITLVNRASQYYELTTHAAWATVNQKLVSGGVATDSICVVGYDATHYATMNYVGTWTDTAP